MYFVNKDDTQKLEFCLNNAKSDEICSEQYFWRSKKRRKVINIDLLQFDNPIRPAGNNFQINWFRQFPF